MLERPAARTIAPRSRRATAASKIIERARGVHSNIGAVPKGGIDDPASYCEEYVRKHDYEGYLTSPFYPGEAQKGFLALKAFSVELANVQEAVSNPMIGKMRMQFWRDAVKNLTEGRPPQHPIALALHDASRRANLAPYHLKRIIDARDSELDNPTHLTLDSLTSHAEATSSTLFYLLLSLLRLSSNDDLAHAASHLGAAQTIAVLLRALPYHASKKHAVIPAEITARHGVSQEDVFRRGPAAKGLEDAVFEFATAANDHLLAARDMFGRADAQARKEAMPLFLGGVPIASYLSRLEAVNFNPFDPSLQRRHWKLPWNVWRGYFKKAF
ncbi:hypothetical protein PUNSTDRAFT_97434 [Punctularia strigosozonata HHB-11173 SS5]|uniref:uncharacterized protein n=1 Tax=Punctularia strigosozonata (strain HHB-11173) TaxID=741275 RepID=UPI0004417F48|nr:uncharacterized protein PUNSTDRAFT_97434 [Punctularia strigosozonata HHB-11173 SS5]EIN12633.1 hypothetical protein PUNSTDRAFT_97434 [Punctularia strigosozonata HHB-11173 SS5]